LSDREKILNKLDEIATELAGDLERGAWGGKTITLKYKTDAFQSNLIILSWDTPSTNVPSSIHTGQILHKVDHEQRRALLRVLKRIRMTGRVS
jgi:hypothetical protein